MTTRSATSAETGSAAGRAVTRRLRPLLLAQFVASIALWLPVEKVFMTELGFTPALVATMAASYAAVVPMLEIPCGILADRWSRRGVLMVADAVALLSVLLGAISQNVATYIVSAMLLGGYLALQSGTVDSIVYDTLVEETGNAEGFQRHYGRIQVWSSIGLTGSALVGGVVAGVLSARASYVGTVPFLALGLLLLLRFREPTLHRQVERTSLRTHLGELRRVMVGSPRIAAIVIASALTAATTQMLFEFGPLWLLAAGVGTATLGPYTAAMTATLGGGGWLAGHLHLGSRRAAATLTSAIALSALTLVASAGSWLVIAGQIVLAALLATLGIHLSRHLHDAVPSHLRTGAASGASTVSWLTFLPCSLLFGVVSEHGGVRAAGWIVLLMATLAGLMITVLGRSSAPRPPATEPQTAVTTPVLTPA